MSQPKRAAKARGWPRSKMQRRSGGRHAGKELGCLAFSCVRQRPTRRPKATGALADRRSVYQAWMAIGVAVSEGRLGAVRAPERSKTGALR